ncbi:hypothetical protein PoHVEF18_007137 [Penicillium ochrochloron]
MNFKLSTLVALLAIAAPALARNAVVDGLNKISKQVAGVEQKADKVNVVTLAAQGPQVVQAYAQEVQYMTGQINGMPSSLPSDVQADVCNAWAAYSENQKHLLSVLIYKEALMHSVGLGDPIRGLLHADESANNQYTFDLFALASDCSGTLGKRRNELADLYAEAIRTYES